VPVRLATSPTPLRNGGDAEESSTTRTDFVRESSLNTHWRPHLVPVRFATSPTIAAGPLDRYRRRKRAAKELGRFIKRTSSSNTHDERIRTSGRFIKPFIVAEHARRKNSHIRTFHQTSTHNVPHAFRRRYRPSAAHDVTTEWSEPTFREPTTAGSKLSTASGLQRVQFRIGKKRTPTRPIECTFRGQSKSGIPGLRCVQSGIVEERHTAEHAAIAESPTGWRRGGPRIGERGKRKHVAIEFVLRQI